MAKATKVKGLGKKAPVVENAAEIISVRLDDMYQFAPYVEDPRNINEIHNLRIAAKRLRYTLEMFEFAFPSEIKDLISEVKKVQSTIGDMRDADIMVETVLDILAERTRARSERLRDIAMSADRGTIAQRKQRIGEALSAPTVQRDDIAYYTLVAHKADISNESYEKFLVAWRKMHDTDFYGRLRRFVGVDPPLDPPEDVSGEDEDEILAEEHIPPEESMTSSAEPAE